MPTELPVEIPFESSAEVPPELHDEIPPGLRAELTSAPRGASRNLKSRHRGMLDRMHSTERAPELHAGSWIPRPES